MLLKEVFERLGWVRCPNDSKDDIELVILLALLFRLGSGAWRQREARLAGEEWHTREWIWEVLCHHAQELGEDAANGPDIDRVAVELVHEDDFWCSVPSSHDMLGQFFGELHLFRHSATSLEGHRHCLLLEQALLGVLFR